MCTRCNGDESTVVISARTFSSDKFERQVGGACAAQTKRTMLAPADKLLWQWNYSRVLSALAGQRVRRLSYTGTRPCEKAVNCAQRSQQTGAPSTLYMVAIDEGLSKAFRSAQVGLQFCSLI